MLGAKLCLYANRAGSIPGHKKNTRRCGCLFWRPGSESNRHRRICSPLHNHSATRPEQQMHLTQKIIVFQHKNSIIIKEIKKKRECA